MTEKEQAEKRYARNTFVTPVFEQSEKDWESLKMTVLLQMLIKLEVKNVMPKKQALKEKDMKEKTLNVKDIEPLSRKRTKRKKYARNTFVTPVFERSGKDWESLKTTVLLQMLRKLVVKNVMPKETGIKRTKTWGKER